MRESELKEKNRLDSLKSVLIEKEKLRVRKEKEAKQEIKKQEMVKAMSPEERQAFFEKEAKKLAKQRKDSLERAEKLYNRKITNKDIYYDLDGNLVSNIDTITILDSKFKGLTAKERNEYRFNFDRALLKVSIKNYKDAIKHLSKCLELTPENKEILQLRGNALVEEGHYKFAKKDFIKALSIKEDEIVYYNLAATQAKLGDFEDAIVSYTKAIIRSPDYLLAYQGRGAARAVSGDLEGSIEDYDEAIKLNQYFTSAYKGRGVSKCLMGKYKESINDFSMVLQFKPEDGFAYYYRGLAYHGMKMILKGCNDLNKAKELGIFQAELQMKELCK